MTPTLISLSAWALLMSVARIVLRGASALAGLLAALGPLGLWCWRQIRLDERRRHAFKMAAGLIAITHARFAHFESGAGIVLDPGLGMLTLSLDGLARRYAYADVRRWHIDPQTHELRVWVADAELPSWQIPMAAELTRRSWAESLKQQIDEGRRLAPPVKALDYAAH